MSRYAQASPSRATEAEADVDPSRVFKVRATDEMGETVDLAYTNCSVTGHGSFGVVMRAELVKGGKGVVALKRTRQDRKFKNRELQIMRVLHHPNVVRLRYYYYEATSERDDDDVFLNLVLDFYPETIYRTYRNYSKRRQAFPEVLVKLYMFQLFRALSYIHSMDIMHRDIKPHNILVDPDKGVVTLIDFGSAKVLKAGEPNVSYTCSRYYRAPELTFGSTKYSLSIDIWSSGCILGELLQGSVLFPGSSGIDQLVEIIKVLGTPTKEQIKMMNPNYTEHRFPQIRPVALARLIPKASSEALDLLTRLLAFDPTERISACEAMTHPFFDELKASPTKLQPNGVRLPKLFNFTRQELSVRPDLIRQLVPPWAESALWDESGVDVNHFVPLDLATVKAKID